MSEFLSAQELHDLTGCARPTSQASWLKDHRVAHRLDGRRVIVSMEMVRLWLEGVDAEPDPDADPVISKDWRDYILSQNAERKMYQGSQDFDSFEGLYSLWNDDQLIYIGRSGSVRNRLYQHYLNKFKPNGRQWTHWTGIEVPPLLLNLVEAAHITALFPIGNGMIPPCHERELEMMVEKIKELWEVAENECI